MTTVESQPVPSTRLELGYDKKLMLFSGRANPELAAKIADKLGVVPGPVQLKTFSNGEVYCRYGESIRGADVFLVQPTCANAATGMTPNDALMELLLMIDAAVGAVRTASSPSRPGSATAARTRSPRRASRSRPASWPA